VSEVSDLDYQRVPLFGQNLVIVPDLNSDGHCDLIVSEPSIAVGNAGRGTSGALFAISGSDGRGISRLNAQVGEFAVGSRIALMPESLIDELGDCIALSYSFEPGTTKRFARLRSFHTSPLAWGPLDVRLGEAMVNSTETQLLLADDLDGDQYEEVLVVGSGYDQSAMILVVSLMRAKVITDVSIGRKGFLSGAAATMIPDQNGDGHRDVLIGSPRVSGAGGAGLLEVVSVMGQGEVLASSGEHAYGPYLGSNVWASSGTSTPLLLAGTLRRYTARKRTKPDIQPLVRIRTDLSNRLILLSDYWPSRFDLGQGALGYKWGMSFTQVPPTCCGPSFRRPRTPWTMVA